MNYIGKFLLSSIYFFTTICFADQELKGYLGKNATDILNSMEAIEGRLALHEPGEYIETISTIDKTVIFIIENGKVDRIRVYRSDDKIILGDSYCHVRNLLSSYESDINPHDYVILREKKRGYEYYFSVTNVLFPDFGEVSENSDYLCDAYLLYILIK